MKKILATLTHPIVLGLLLAASGFLLGALMGGCSKAPEPQPQGGPAPRRATALELLEASRGTNEPPAWFSEQEKAAVQKLRAP